MLYGKITMTVPYLKNFMIWLIVMTVWYLLKITIVNTSKGLLQDVVFLLELEHTLLLLLILL